MARVSIRLGAEIGDDLDVASEYCALDAMISSQPREVREWQQPDLLMQWREERVLRFHPCTMFGKLAAIQVVERRHIIERFQQTALDNLIGVFQRW